MNHSSSTPMVDRLPPEIVEIVRNGLKFWLEEAESDIGFFAAENSNISLNAIEGVNAPQTWTLAVDLLFKLFRLIERFGYGADWLPIFEQAYVCRPTDDLVRQFRLLNLTGQLQRRNGQLDLALATHERAQKLGEVLDADLYRGHIAYSFAGDYLAMGETEQGLTYVREALACFEQTPDELFWQAKCHLLVGELTAFQSDDVEPAYGHFKTAVSLFEQVGDTDEVRRGYITLAWLMFNKKRPSEAETYFEKAFALFGEKLDPVDWLNYHINLGTHYYLIGQLEKAAEAFMQMDDPRMKKLPMTEQRALLNYNLGNVMFNLKRHDRAIIHLTDAISLYERVGNRYMLALSKGKKGEAHCTIGEADEGVALLDEAITLLQRLPQSEPVKKFLEKFTSLQDRNS